MKQIILPTILEFTRLVNDGFMKENSLAKKRKLGSPIQKVPKKFKLFPAPNYKRQKHTHTHTHTHTQFSPTKKILVGVVEYVPWKIC